MIPKWLKLFCEDADISPQRVEVVWAGKHVVLLKKKRPVRWFIIDKEWPALESPARHERFAGKPILETELAVGRLSRPDFERLLDRTKKLDVKYPMLRMAKQALEKERKAQTLAARLAIHKQVAEAKKRAQRFRGLLKRALIAHEYREHQVMDRGFTLEDISIELANGISLRVGSNLDGLRPNYISLELADQLTPEQLFAVVKKLNAFRFPKDTRK